VVRQLAQVVTAAAVRGLPASVCGEMASEPLSAVLLMGLGYRIFSIAPPSIPMVKWVVRSVPIAAAQAAAAVALQARGPADVDEALREAVAPHVDLRLIDPHAALQARGRVVSLPNPSQPA
jgi:signal transduction protein with GAF and PtsI domain